MNQSMFLCVYVSIPSVMLLVLLLGLEPVIKFIITLNSIIDIYNERICSHQLLYVGKTNDLGLQIELFDKLLLCKALK